MVLLLQLKNSHVVINEAGSMSHEDQWHLIGIAEEGKTTLDKYGEHIPIDAPTISSNTNSKSFRNKMGIFKNF